MTDITDRARKPLVDRAKDWCADAQVAHTYGVGIRADLSTIAMIRELVAEVERLRKWQKLHHADALSYAAEIAELRGELEAHNG